MSVFDSKTKIRTRVGIGKDAWKPGMGALGKGSQKDEALIHGTKKEQIDMNHMSTVNLNRTFQTNINFQCTVGVMRKLQDTQYLHTTNAMLKRDVMGPSLYNRVGPTMITFVAPLVESHASPRSLAEPAVRMEQVTNAIKAALDDQEVQGFAKSATGLKMEAIGISMTATGAETFVKGVAAGVSVLEDMTKVLFNRNANAEWKKKAVELDIEALETKTGLDLASLKLAANSITL
jgi:hypothetical protein